MKYEYTGAEKIAVITALAGAVMVTIMPFFSIPFHVPYPSWALTPMEYGIYLFFVSVLVVVVGAPASIIAIRQKRRKLGWLSLIGCVFIWPLGVAACFFVAFLFGEHINIH
jgi:hypothetical protein